MTGYLHYVNVFQFLIDKSNRTMPEPLPESPFSPFIPGRPGRPAGPGRP